MMPYLHPGDRILVSSISFLFSKPKIGDVVVMKDKKTAKMLAKRIVEISNSKFRLKGDNKEDNLKIGLIQREEILGKVIIRIPNNQ